MFFRIFVHADCDLASLGKLSRPEYGPGFLGGVQADYLYRSQSV